MPLEWSVPQRTDVRRDAKMTRSNLLLFLVGIVVCSASSAAAFDETVEVHSLNLTDEEFLRGNPDAGSPVRLNGRLACPDSKEELPVVILLHGTNVSC